MIYLYSFITMADQHEPTRSGPSGNDISQQSRQNLPNANTVLILGIASILLCWWHFISVIGIALALTALILANKETRLYYQNPGIYSESSLNNVKTGRICALIGLIISLIIFAFVVLLAIGLIATLPFWGMIR